MEYYFLKFPSMIYNNIECKDLTRRVKITANTLNVPNIFYPMEITNSTRPDLMAEFHFEDQYADWIIYLTNGIIDPYYGWYLDQDEFDSFIAQKYGSYENSLKKIKEYRVNWATVDLEIPPSVYDNNLPSNLKKYYMPNFGDYSRIVSYKRREEDWTIATNQIIKFSVNYNSNTSFIDGELVDIKTGVNVSSNSGVEVISSNSSTITLKNISGNTAIDNYIVGETSGANATITAIEYLANNLVDNEKIFWSPVTYYDYESEKNEKNKNIVLLAKESLYQVSEEVKRAINT